MNCWCGLVILVAIFSATCAQNGTSLLESLPRQPFEIEELPSPEQVEKDLRTLRSLITEGESSEEDYELVRQAYFARYNRSNGEPEVGFLILTDEDHKPDIDWPSMPRQAFEEAVQNTSSLKKSYRFKDAVRVERTCCQRGFSSSRGVSVKVGYISWCIVIFRKRACNDNWCKRCTDTLRLCESFEYRCKEYYYGDMWSLLCPVTCGKCTARNNKKGSKKTSAGRGVIKPVLRTVNVYINRRGMYRFDISSSWSYAPWMSVSSSARPGEVASFRMFDRPKGAYTAPVYFCKAKIDDGYKWMVKKSKCGQGWELDFRLYASPKRVAKSQKLYVSNRGSPQFSSRVSSEKPCCGYDITTCVMFVRDFTN